MVKKLQKMAAKQKAAAASPIPGLPPGLLDSALAQTVKDSAQQIWAAGLAAFNKAQGEGGKAFDHLVEEGMNMQKKTQSAAEEKISAVASKMSGMAGEVGAKAGQHWDKLESIFEDRVARALKRLGVPTSKEIESLIARIDALSAAVGGKPAAAPRKSAAAKHPGAKSAVKSALKTVVKKAAAKKSAPKTGPKTVEAAPARKVPARKRAAAV